MESETKGRLYEKLLADHAATFEGRTEPLSDIERGEMRTLLIYWLDILTDSLAENDETILKEVLGAENSAICPRASLYEGKRIKALEDYHIYTTAATPCVQKLLPYPGYAPYFSSKFMFREFGRRICAVDSNENDPETNCIVRRCMDLARADRDIIKPHNARKLDDFDKAHDAWRHIHDRLGVARCGDVDDETMYIPRNEPQIRERVLEFATKDAPKRVVNLGGDWVACAHKAAREGGKGLFPFEGYVPYFYTAEKFAVLDYYRRGSKGNFPELFDDVFTGCVTDLVRQALFDGGTTITLNRVTRCEQKKKKAGKADFCSFL